MGKSPARVPFTIFRTKDHLMIPLGTRKVMEEKKLVETDFWFKGFLFFFLRQNVLEESSKNRKSHSCLRCWKDVGRTHGLISCSVMW